jgi:predicted deacetylase
MNATEAGVIVSVHDVMPQTLERVAGILGRLEAAGTGGVSLLVVPGAGWTADTLDRLHGMLARGHRLAGHGWHHRCPRVRGLKHRLHSALISRDVAEHLALDAAGIEALIRRCGEWFPRHGLPQPDTYVPPAWAMGGIPRSRLYGLGFRYFETLTGVFDAGAGRFRRLPLAGFEADTRFRALALRTVNRVCASLASADRPLRIAIHPRDPELLLARDLELHIAAAGGRGARGAVDAVAG